MDVGTNRFCGGVMKEVPIKNSRYKLLVDDEDFEKAIKYTWYKGGKQVKAFEGYCKFINLPNLVMNDFESQFDHKDRNYLNNQKENLRACTQSQNLANRIKLITTNSTSKYKGVYFSVRGDTWVARIQVKGKTRTIGRYLTEENAAKQYNRAAIEYFGEFALLNIIDKSADIKKL